MAEKDRQTPDEEQIIALLTGFKPQPSPRFYKRMAAAPWAAGSPAARAQPRWLTYLRPAAALALFALVLLAGIFVYPPLNAVARQMMSYFVPAASDYQSVRITVPLVEAQSTPGPFSLTLAEAQQAAGYPIKEISALPPGMEFAGALYEPRLDSVTIRYVQDASTLFFTQRPVDIVEEHARIGASAPVETLQVSGVQGEYVEGGWVITPAGDQALQTATPGTQVSVGLVWDAQLPQRILRWQEGEMSYEIVSSGTELSKQALLAMAESVR